ncbi:carboxymuconolactone decarboxylase family protein [Pseudooceanicola sp.]|uniref:carboxymuconolactone decarboxylase family protein n=1 Tax=Pseudooceanicola sp. TaxID=1914328 RepID=UPI00262793AB|nr:carboxymuconolactone decarboxylase family protein [Pseudooceanicola sp.]MDF1855506.1 carboxymuconolactone decarboxylase family protein [Pseudooceanicola sp.]
MADARNPFEAMLEQAQAMAKAMNPALENFNPKGFEAIWPTLPKEFMEMAFGKSFNKDGLDSKTRLFLMLAGLVIQGAQAESQLRLTVRHLIAAGATHQEVAEAIAQMTMFAGVPAVTKAGVLAKEVMDEMEGEEE